MHPKPYAVMPWQFARPPDDIFLRIAVQVPLPEGRGIQGFEKLADLFDLEFDGRGQVAPPVSSKIPFLDGGGLRRIKGGVRSLP